MSTTTLTLNGDHTIGRLTSGFILPSHDLQPIPPSHLVATHTADLVIHVAAHFTQSFIQWNLGDVGADAYSLYKKSDCQTFLEACGVAARFPAKENVGDLMLESDRSVIFMGEFLFYGMGSINGPQGLPFLPIVYWTDYPGFTDKKDPNVVYKTSCMVIDEPTKGIWFVDVGKATMYQPSPDIYIKLIIQ